LETGEDIDRASSGVERRLVRALLAQQQTWLVEIWGCSAQEVSRRVNGDRNISLKDFCKVIAALDIKLVIDGDSITMPRDRARALMTLAAERVRDLEDELT